MFCVHPNPYTKLNALCELEQLIVASLASGGSSRRKLTRMTRLELKASSIEQASGSAAAAAVRPSPLEDAIGNIKERLSQVMAQQTSTLLNSPVSASSPGRAGAPSAETRSITSAGPAGTDAARLVLQSLFRDPSIRPKTLFRDLQFIASFVSPSVLHQGDRGKAFLDTVLAAILLKHEVCQTMVEVADEVVKIYTERRQSTSSSSASLAAASSHDAAAQTSTSLSSSPQAAHQLEPVPTSQLTLADAARMLAITAKEGDPTAQRELALFYLSRPELVDRTTLPLSKPREVFKQAIMDTYGTSKYHSSYPSGASSSSSGGGGAMGGGASGPSTSTGDVRTDPALMCVAFHWMVAAGRGGDQPATTFLEQNRISGLD